MSANIVELIISQLGGGALSKLSSFLGESSDRTQSAVGAAVPTLLAGLSNAASTPEGARNLANAADEHANNLSGGFGSMLDRGASLSSAGSSVLGSLFGGGTLSSLSSILGRFTGLQGGSVTNLLGMLAPLVLGVLGRHKRESGLNASGLAGFLGDQKQNIAAAMPSGLSSMLGSLPGFSGFAQKAEREAEPAYADTTSQMETSRPTAHAGSSKGKWALGLLAALALISAWTMTQRHNASRTEAPIKESAGSALPEASSLTTSLKSTLSDTTLALRNITDAESAEKAMPQLNQLNTKLGNMKSQWDSLPESAKPGATAAIQPSLDNVSRLVKQLRGTPAVGDKLKPTLDELETKIAAF